MKDLGTRLLEGIDVMAAVVDSASFGRAGETLDMSQSGVSRAIARLEARLGIRVFERTTRSVRLTDEGRRFYEQVMPLVGAIAEVTVSAAGGAAVVRGRLRVNVDPFFSQLILGPKLGEFLDGHPALEVELRSRDDLGDMVADGFDLAIRFGHPQSSSLVARKLFDTRILTVASPAYLQRYGHPVDPHELETGHHRCVRFRDSATGRPFPWEFHRRGRTLTVAARGVLTVNDAATLYSTCLAGHGIAQLFELGIGAFVDEGQLTVLFQEWPDERFPLYAYYPTRQHVPAKTRAFLDFVARLVT